jgi:hypothetical protein
MSFGDDTLDPANYPRLWRTISATIAYDERAMERVFLAVLNLAKAVKELHERVEELEPNWLPSHGMVVEALWDQSAGDERIFLKKGDKGNVVDKNGYYEVRVGGDDEYAPQIFNYQDSRSGIERMRELWRPVDEERSETDSK